MTNHCNRCGGPGETEKVVVEYGDYRVCKNLCAECLIRFREDTKEVIDEALKEQKVSWWKRIFK